MPKHKIQEYRPLYINRDGEILVLLKTGRYVPLEDCDLPGLSAFGKTIATSLIPRSPMAITPSDAGDITITGVGDPVEDESGSVIGEVTPRRTRRKKAKRGD